jgi:hypothetical protein
VQVGHGSITAAAHKQQWQPSPGCSMPSHAVYEPCVTHHVLTGTWPYTCSTPTPQDHPDRHQYILLLLLLQ